MRRVSISPRIVFWPSSLPELLHQVPQEDPIGTVTADGAYDTRRCHAAMLERDAVPFVGRSMPRKRCFRGRISSRTDHRSSSLPHRRTGRPWKDDGPAARLRNETLRATSHYGKAFWTRWTGDHTRSRIEAKMRCFKAFGDRIAARDPARQPAEVRIRIALMTRISALGTAEIVRVS